MSELPENWEETSFGEVVRSVAINDKKLPRKQYATSGKFPVVDQGQEFIGGYSDDADRVVEDDLPLVIFGDHTRIFKFLNRPFVPGADGVKVLKPLGVDEKWLYHIAHALEFPDKGYARHFQHLKKARLLVPPLPEQRRIVNRIEELFSRLDAGVAALRHAKAQLQRYRQSVLAAAVTGQLTQAWREQHPDTEPAEELLERILEERRETWSGKGKYKEPVPANDDFGRSPPATWKIASMDAITCHVTSGSRDWKQYYTDDGYAVFVMAQNVRPLRFDSNPVIRVAPPDGDRDKARSAVAENDLLVTIVGANTGDVCRVDNSFDDYYVCQSVALLRPVESATATYLELYMNSEEHGQDQFAKWMYGQGRPHLSFDQLRSTAVFLPPLDEQHQIVAEVEARTTAIDHLEVELDRQITRSTHLRQTLLQAAFAGRL